MLTGESLAAADPMLASLLDFLRAHDEVRAAVLNGSRANPNAPRDRWQDYDINIAERTPGYFLAHQQFLDRFGPRIIMQLTHGFQLPDGGWQDVTQEEYAVLRASGETLPGIHHYNIMVIFATGVRVDFSFVPATEAHATYTDSLTIPLLDKDGLLPAFPPPSESGYHIAQPTPAAFRATCNEFFWVSTYVAKGLLRGEVVYAKACEQICREQLDQMLLWLVGSRHAFKVNAGNKGKWLQRFLTAAEWEALLATYAGADMQAQWRALFAAAALFRTAAQEVSARLGAGYAYDLGEDERTVAYLHQLAQIAPLDTEDTEGTEDTERKAERNM